MDPTPSRREEKKARRKRNEQGGTRNQEKARVRVTGRAIPVDHSKLVSCSMLSGFPKFYEDQTFHCQDCGKWQLWTASQQKWWYEVAGGKSETTATRCRECRRKERERKAEARRIHQEGLEKKRKKS